MQAWHFACACGKYHAFAPPPQLVEAIQEGHDGTVVCQDGEDEADPWRCLLLFALGHIKQQLLRKIKDRSVLMQMMHAFMPVVTSPQLVPVGLPFPPGSAVTPALLVSACALRLTRAWRM